jgi:hypothetical protein
VSHHDALKAGSASSALKKLCSDPTCYTIGGDTAYITKKRLGLKAITSCRKIDFGGTFGTSHDSVFY